MEFATPLLCFFITKAGLAVSKKSETNESLYIYMYTDTHMWLRRPQFWLGAAAVRWAKRATTRALMRPVDLMQRMENMA